MDDPKDVGVRAKEGTGRERRSHRLLVVLLTALATVLLLASALNLWVKRQALDTDAWVSASDELLQDPAVRTALSTYVVDELYRAVDVAAFVREQLPPSLQGLAGPLSGVVRQPAYEAVERLLATPQARTAWQTINREAHAALVRVLEDKTRDGVSTADGVVTVDLGVLVRQVGEQLGLPDGLLDRIPEGTGTFTLVTSERLAAAQSAVRVIELLSAFLVILVVALYALAVYLARGWRRVALRNVGWCVVFVSLLLLVVQRLVGNYVVNELVDVPSYQAAARSSWLIAAQLLRQLAWVGVLLGGIVVLYAILTGPGRLATRSRQFLAPAIGARAGLVWGAAVLVFLLLVAWSPIPAFRSLTSTLVLAVLTALGLEALRRQTMAEFPPGRPTGGGGLPVAADASGQATPGPPS
jgi:hypothetical protein